jgi:hypothetical protein
LPASFADTIRRVGAMARHEAAKVTGLEIAPGGWVRHPQRPDWGRGQIQSVVGARITVNFEHAGKLLIDGSKVQLEPIDPDTDA